MLDKFIESQNYLIADGEENGSQYLQTSLDGQDDHNDGIQEALTIGMMGEVVDYIDFIS